MREKGLKTLPFKPLKKILLITPRFPFPVIGGDKLRIYNIVKYLSAFYRFTLVSLYSTEEEEKAEPEEGLFEKTYKIRQSKFRSGYNVIKHAAAGKSLQSGYFFNKKLKALIQLLAPEHDVLFAHLVRTYEYVKDIKGIPMICEMTDAISSNYRLVKAVGGRSFKKIVFSFEQKRCLSSELECLRHFNKNILVSHHDREYLTGHLPHLSEKVDVITNGVDYRKYPYPRASVRKGKIIFIGNMRTLQNADAACYFAREIFTKIYAGCPDSRFWIIGADPTPEVKALGKIPGVFVTGKVDDITHYAQDAMVSVCPMRIGAGVQNKILESMAMGIPVVTSSLGLSGLMARDTRDVLVADTPDEYITKILRIHNDINMTRRLTENARACIENNYAWEKTLCSYKDLIDGLVH